MNSLKPSGFILLALLSISTVLFFDSCKGKKFNLFTIEDDRALGAQVAEEIASRPDEYPILDSIQYREAYNHLRRITQTILDGGEVATRDQFLYRTFIIRDDNTLNAFCTPGGYIYVYTGLIKYLDAEYQLAGVMGHEIAHADKRHSTRAMTRQFGYQLLLDIAFGQDKGALARVAAGLREMAYGRDAEREADAYSVTYLYPTEYDARGAARFFEKLEATNQSVSVPEFLSTHPNPGNRIEAIISDWEKKGAKPGQTFSERYQQFKNSLP